LTTVAEFEIEYQQFLDAEGKLREPAPPLAHESAELIKMYRLMTLVRAFDTKAVNLQRTGQLGTYASCLGHEATHVAVGAAMRPEDVLAPVYREFGTQIWRGVKLSEILTYWGGDERGCDFSGPRQDFPWCIPIASQMLHGAGVAMAFKIRGEARWSVTYIGDGGTSEGAFYEGINLAGAKAWDGHRENALKADCARQIEAAVAHYLSAPKPTTDAMFDSLFAKPTRSLLEQRETARRYANEHGH
jgi:pyruvate dehydrogenase E1 component alpha subunit